MSDTNPGEAGWQADPSGKHDHRYWDGSQWTDNVSDGGVASTDPFVAGAAAAAMSTPGDPAPADPTVTEPVAMTPPDPTSSFSAGGPPPPTAAMPAAAAADGGGGGSKKGLLIGGGILAIVAIIVAVLALSGGDDKDSADELHTKLAAEFGEGLSDEDADCVASYLVDNVDHDTLAGLDYSSTDVPDEIQQDTVKALAECNVDLGGGDSSTTTTSGSDDSTTTTQSSSTDGSSDGTTDAGIDYSSFRDLIVSQFTQQGLSQDQAECLADKVVDGLESGDFSEDQAMSNILDFFAACDIDPSEIGGN